MMPGSFAQGGDGVLRDLVLKNMAALASDERVRRWYAAMQGALVGLESSHGVYVDEIILAAVLVYHDRKKHPSDSDFKVPLAHELQAIFDELDADAQVEPLLTWLAKNFNRFFRFVKADPWTYDTLGDLMRAKVFAVRERNPIVLRAVIQFALAEYLLRGYDMKALYAVFEKLHLPPARRDE